MRDTERVRSHPLIVLLLSFCLSFALYLVALVAPYNIFSYVAKAPISMPEIAEREPLPAVAFLLTFLAAFILYALAYWSCSAYARRGLAPFILLSGLALALLLSLTYPIGAGDVVDYVSHGETLAYFGANPLVTPPAQIPGALLARYSAFRDVASNYGPLWTWISGLVVGLLGRESLLLDLLGFKAVAILAYLAQAILIYIVLRRRRPPQAHMGLIFFAWNPLILYEFAANGHNDATMMALVLLGIFFWERRRLAPMVIALALSFLVKIPSAPLLPLFLLAMARHRGRVHTARILLMGALLAIAVILLAYLSLPDPWPALTNLSARSDLFTHSLPTVVNLGLQQLGVERGNAQAVARAGALLALTVWYVVQLRGVWREPLGAVRYAYSFLLFFLLFATLWFQPWYVTWLVALAALLPDSTAPTQVGLFSLTVMISYVVYGFVWFWIPAVANWGQTLGITLMAVGTTYLIPWAYMARLWLRGKQQEGLRQPEGA